jgi:cyclophilin family peptidyl-prolyl cis-trans isomerase
MPSGRVSTRAPRGSRLALVAFLSVAGLVVWAAYLTFARAAEHHAVIESFHHPHVLRQHARPRFGSDRTAGGVISRLSPRRDAHAGVHGDGRSNGATDDFRPDDVDVATRREATRDEAMAWAEKTFVHAGKERSSKTSESLDVLASCGDSKPHTEYWGDVVVDASALGRVASAGVCCAKCAETLGCNVWVHCSADAADDAAARKKAAWCDGQCWLKRVDDPTSVAAHGRGDEVPWTSGSLLKDYDKNAIDANAGERGSDVGEWEDALPGGPRVVDVVTPAGSMRVALRPDWHLPSVTFVQRLATEKGCAGGSCHLYRVEPGFLVQGTMRSFNVGSNTRTLRGPKIMERGEIGWAGGSAGPDFFVYLGKYPADWLGHDHTVFGVLEDEASLAVAEKIVAMDSHTPGGPNTMRFLREKMTFDVVAAEE